MAAIDHREAVRRQHRELSLFLGLQCWCKNLDGVILEREAIKRLLGIEDFKEDRWSLLKEDLAELFPYQKEFTELELRSRSLHLSRREFEPGWREVRIDGKTLKVPGEKPALGLVPNWPVVFKDVEAALSQVAPFIQERGAACEQIIALYLSLAIQGKIPAGSWSILDPD